MKKLIKTYLFLFFFYSLSAQDNTFVKNLNKILDDSVVVIKPKIFLLNSGRSTISSNTYLLGLKCNINVNEKLSISSDLDYLDGNHIDVVKIYKDSLDILPGFGNKKNRFLFNINYNLNRIFKIDYGQGKNFIGHGYRSLILSNEPSHYPFLRISTNLNKIKYYNIYFTLTNPWVNTFGRKKHAAIHFLDFNINSNFSFGLFEAVLWQSKTEDRNVGYEIAYLNPIIFYRPVEYSMGSNKGNALMGAITKINYKRYKIYAQILLDDINISRQKSSDPDNYQSGFFQNKFGYQIGSIFENKNLYFNLEYNQVQPYTYGHRTILQNYSHMNQSLAHPLGANFKEIINIFSYEKGNYKFILKNLFVNIGMDSLNTHYGQNIFNSDYDASTGGQASYGNVNGQGVNTNVILIMPEISYKFKYFDFFSSIYYLKKKSDLIDQTSINFMLGIRNIPFSLFPF